MKHEQCPLPFHQLYFHSSGRVYPCGFLQNNVLVGDLAKQSISQIWDSPEMLRFRERHQKGEFLFCEQNQKKYNCHLLHADMNKFKENETALKRIDFMVDSFCNLKCKMCTNILEEANKFTSEDMMRELEKNILPNLDQIEIIGGEPFVLEDTYRLIKLGAKANPDLKWWFTTNGHFNFNKSFTSHLDKIRIDSMAISIDSLQEKRFASIRTDGQLSKVLETLDHFINYRTTRDESFHLVINFLLQKENWDELPELIRFSRGKGIKHYPILLRDPLEYSILSFDNKTLIEILDFYILENKKLKDHKLMNIILKISKHIDKVSKMERIEDIDMLSKSLVKNV